MIPGEDINEYKFDDEAMARPFALTTSGFGSMVRVALAVAGHHFDNEKLFDESFEICATNVVSLNRGFFICIECVPSKRES